MNINICQLFKVRNNVESGVSLVETPLAYVGTNDHAVIRVRPLPGKRYQISDGGNADWFASTAGFDFEGSAANYFISEQAALFGIQVNDEGEIFSVAQADDLPVQILRVAQCSVSLYSTVVLRPQKVASAFKDELREAIFSVMQKEEVQEKYVVPDSHEITVDYFLSRASFAPIYIVAAADKSRLLEAELLSVQLRSQQRKDRVIAVIESQSKVGRAEYERSSYFVDKSLVFDKEQLPQMLRTLN